MLASMDVNESEIPFAVSLRARKVWNSVWQRVVRELATIADYRGRLNQYRTDANLMFAHQRGPWITTW